MTDINYPWGWAQAGNTPLKRYKQNTHAGGVRTSCIVRLPGAAQSNEIRDHFHHVTDVVPTILDLLDLEAPAVHRGLAQLPIDGLSMRDTFFEPAASPRARTQYFEMLGHRAIWKDGWKAVAFHPKGHDYNDDVWELYHLDEDFSEYFDLAKEMPEKLAELVTAWWVEAGRHKVLPLDDRGFAERAAVSMRPGSPRDRKVFRYVNGIDHIGNGAGPVIVGRSYAIRADIVRADDSADGVLIAHGSVNSGYSLLIRDGHLVHDYNYYGQHLVVTSPGRVPVGRSSVGLRFDKDHGATSGVVTLVIDDAEVATQPLAETFENFVAFQGLDVGGDRLSPARQDGRGHGDFAFAGVLDLLTISILDSDGSRDYEPLD